MLRPLFGISDKLALVRPDDIPKQFCYRPRPIAVKDYKAETSRSQFSVDPNKRLSRYPLKKCACFRVNRSTDKIVRRRVSDIKLYRVVEFGEFYQICLSFVFLFRWVLASSEIVMIAKRTRQS